MKITWIVFMVFALCASFSTLGQVLTYKGGFGNGSEARKSAQITLSGSGDLVAFKGGVGRGSSAAKSIVIQMGGSQSLNFTGGAGDGTASIKTDFLSLSGINQTLTFPGGQGDGIASSLSNLQKLEGSSYLSIPFSGGSGRGNTLSEPLQTGLGGIVISQTFTGGIGRGNNIQQSVVLYMSGASYVYSFTGGNGRGNTKTNSQKLTLAGIVSPGFARVAQSAIVDFKAVPRQNKVRLNWKAENQEILDHFVIERSTDGVDFNSIGFVSSGSDHQTGQFSFPLTGNGGDGTEYFRLLEVFKDSSFSYSSVLKVATSQENESISLYPNPVRDKLNVTLPESSRPEKILIYDHSGQLLKEVRTNGTNIMEINVEDLPAGMYLLETSDQSTINRIRFTRL